MSVAALCQACGLCCDGTLFSVVPLTADDRPPASLAIETRPSGARALRQPCNLSGECCSNSCRGGVCCAVSCQNNADCCSNSCVGFTCQSLAAASARKRWQACAALI